MNPRLFPALLSILPFLLAGPAARGQNAEQNVTLKIDFVAFGEDISGLTIGDGKAVTALGFQYSKPVSYNGPAVLEISRSPGAQPPPPADANVEKIPILPALAERRKEKPNLVALAMLPAQTKRVTLLLAPGSAGTFQAIVLDDDPSKLPYGQMRVSNFCPYVVAMSFNNQLTGEMKPKGSVLIAPKEENVVYVLKYMKEGKWKTQENNLIKVAKDEQVQFVVLQSDASFFRSGNGVRTGFLQIAILRRNLKEPVEPAAANGADS